MVRNAHVLPIWEGTTNVLSLDLLRAAARSDAISAVIEDGRATASEALRDGAVGSAAAAVLEAFDELEQLARQILSDQPEGQAGARSLALGLAQTYAATRLCAQGAWAAARGDLRTAATAARLVQRGLVPPAPPQRLELGMDDPIVGDPTGS
jgi:hypothetical protein